MTTRRLSPQWDMTFGLGLANFASGAEEVAQNVKARLQLLQGEWFLDTADGVPYREQIAVKPANLGVAEVMIKARILATEGVASITAFSTSLDTNRRLAVSATVTATTGDVASINTAVGEDTKVLSQWPLLGDNFVLGKSLLGHAL